MVSSVAGRLTRLRAPGSRFRSSRHLGDRLLWASVHGREECHKMDRPGQVYQETNMQTTRQLQPFYYYSLTIKRREILYHILLGVPLSTIPYKLCRCHVLACYPGTAAHFNTGQTIKHKILVTNDQHLLLLSICHTSIING